MEIKKCYTCQVEKNLDSFPKNRYGKDGTRNQCKDCKNIACVASGYKRKNNQKIDVRYRYGKGEAKRKNRDWTISFEDYETLLSGPCTYCGGELTKTGVGLDRIDSAKGYIPDNVNPCCTLCNIMKTSLSLEEFKNHIQKIFNNFIKKSDS